MQAKNRCFVLDQFLVIFENLFTYQPLAKQGPHVMQLINTIKYN